MVGDEAAGLARLVWQFGEPIHAVVYFAPETRAATDALGLKGGWMSYFGCRAAPLGPVTAAAVTAVFYNFRPSMVERAIPDAWSYASPQQLLEARWSAMDAALRRVLGDAISSSGVRQAAEMAEAAVVTGDFDGRILGRANAVLAAPRDAHLRLWQALTALREHRGDGHVMALVAHGIAPCEALVLQAATGRSPTEGLQSHRGWSSEDWDRARQQLTERGWIEEADRITELGAAVRHDVEAETDRLAGAAFSGLDRDRVTALIDALKPLATQVMESGAVPAFNNMGVPWPPQTIS